MRKRRSHQIRVTGLLAVIRFSTVRIPASKIKNTAKIEVTAAPFVLYGCKTWSYPIVRDRYRKLEEHRSENFIICTLYGSRRGSTWPRGHILCWQVYTNKTLVMPFIPTKSVACMSTSWLLGNVYTAKSCKGKKAKSWLLKLGLVS
jgi:hypothetical protein